MRRPRLLPGLFGLINLRIFSLFIIVLTFASAVAGPAMASSAPTNVELIIDDSGSMAQKIGGGKKIDVAKQVFSGLVQDLPETPSSRCGPTAAGSRPLRATARTWNC
jgi:hypothetical protein